MTTNDYRATQIQTKQIIASGTLGKDGTGAKLVIYPIEAQGTPNNTGVINQNAFNTGSLNGKDIFLFVSGGIGEKNTNNRSITVFGGDVHVSGSITSNGGGTQQWVESSTSPRLRTTASVAIGSDSVFAENIDPSTNFYVSGSKYDNSKFVTIQGDAFFGGNIIQKSLQDAGPNGISGSDNNVSLAGRGNNTNSTNYGSFSTLLAAGTNNTINDSVYSAILGCDSTTVKNMLNGLALGTVNCVITGSDLDLAAANGGVAILGGYTNTIKLDYSAPTIGYSTVIAGGSFNESLFSEECFIASTTNGSLLETRYSSLLNSDNVQILGPAYRTLVASAINSSVSSSDFNYGSNAIVSAKEVHMNDAHVSMMLATSGSAIGYTTTSLIAGGIGNRISGSQSNAAILGGSNNEVNNGSSQDGNVVIGGNANVVSNSYKSSVLSGENNRVTISYNSSILGGSNNSISGSTDSAAVASLSNNVNDSSETAVVAGYSNTFTRTKKSAVVAGQLNDLSDNTNGYGYMAVVAGSSNTLAGVGAFQATYSAVVAGRNNILSGSSHSAAIAAYDCQLNNGFLNVCLGTDTARYFGTTQQSAVIGTSFPVISGGINGAAYNIIGGGTSNSITDGNYNAVFAGSSNSLISNGSSVILGGNVNVLSGSDPAADGQNAIIVGTANKIYGMTRNAVVVGGGYNQISGSWDSSILTSATSSIIGSPMSVVIGGKFNSIPSGMSGSILIGSGLTASLPQQIMIGGRGSGSTGFSVVVSASNGLYLSGSVFNHIPVAKTTTYTVSGSDYIIPVNSAGGTRTVILDSAAARLGRAFVIKDVGGSAASNNITVSASYGKIDSAATYVISQSYGRVTLTCFDTAASNVTWGVISN